MKLAAFALTLIPGIAIASSWTSPGFPTFSTQETGRFTSHAALTKGTRALTLHIDQQCWQPSGAIKLNQMLSLKPCEGAPPQWRLFKDGDYTITVDTRSGTPTLLLSIKTEPERTAQLAYQCPVWDGSPLTLDVRQTFPEGTVVRDYYSGQTDTVQNGQITLQPAALVRAVDQRAEIGFVAHIGIQRRPVLSVIAVIGVMRKIAFCSAADPAVDLFKRRAYPQGVHA